MTVSGKGGLIFLLNFARVAELVDALDLGSSGQPWGFDSPLSHARNLYPFTRKRTES
ncbi:hypothetical protein NITGR_130060 [Nitrospina gracilis 3/211]|uniref:Uncharacterized protein n=1 Tax=Nitrospina gracilis (strain 3/211) TaxID=1266370 RepID=M1YVG5_NITG3|nr:hypothetical protein NITGR_130060 [Nitrospina gracilis 3/211]